MPTWIYNDYFVRLGSIELVVVEKGIIRDLDEEIERKREREREGAGREGGFKEGKKKQLLVLKIKLN